MSSPPYDEDLHIDAGAFGDATGSYTIHVMTTIDGTSGADILAGTRMADLILGSEGNDVIGGFEGSDILRED
ncbi:MAG: hypothetical protein R3D30_07665 [Hyphomicrobiales bacterium]